MLKRLWLVLSLGWTLLVLTLAVCDPDRARPDNGGPGYWLIVFALALAPFAARPGAAGVWAGRKGAAPAK